MDKATYSRTAKPLIKIGDAIENGLVDNTGAGNEYPAYEVNKLGKAFALSANKVPGANHGVQTIRDDFKTGDKVQYAYR